MEKAPELLLLSPNTRKKSRGKLEYDTILPSSTFGKSALGNIFLFDVPDGAGNIFTLNYIVNKLRPDGHCFMPAPTFAVAARLLRSDAAAHSSLRIPIYISLD